MAIQSDFCSDLLPLSEFLHCGCKWAMSWADLNWKQAMTSQCGVTVNKTLSEQL